MTSGEDLGRSREILSRVLGTADAFKMVASMVEHVVADAGAFLKNAALHVSFCFFF